MSSKPKSLSKIKDQLDKARTKSEIMNLVPLFSVMGEGNIEKIAKRIKFKKYKKIGEVLFNKGDEAKEIYIIKSGEVTIYDVIEEKTKNLITLRKGDLFGEMGVILSSPRSLSARISSYTAELYIISKSDFLYMLNKYPELCLNLCKILCRQLKERGDSLVCLSALLECK